jgi:hypothetical protein
MKQQHEVLFEQSELCVVLHGTRLGPRSGALDACLLRLVPVLCGEPRPTWLIKEEGITQRETTESARAQASCPASWQTIAAASADSHIAIGD